MDWQRAAQASLRALPSGFGAVFVPAGSGDAGRAEAAAAEARVREAARAWAASLRERLAQELPAVPLPRCLTAAAPTAASFPAMQHAPLAQPGVRRRARRLHTLRVRPAALRVRYRPAARVRVRVLSRAAEPC